MTKTPYSRKNSKNNFKFIGSFYNWSPTLEYRLLLDCLTSRNQFDVTFQHFFDFDIICSLQHFPLPLVDSYVFYIDDLGIDNRRYWVKSCLRYHKNLESRLVHIFQNGCLTPCWETIVLYIVSSWFKMGVLPFPGKPPLIFSVVTTPFSASPPLNFFFL